MYEAAIFPLTFLNLTTSLCSSTKISLKTRKFQRLAHY